MKKTFQSLFNKPRTVTVIAGIIALFIGVQSYRSHHQAPAYTFAKATIESISETAGANAVNPSHDLTLAFATGGRIKSVSVKVGDKVKSGEVLATLDAGSAAGALSQARGAYAAAKANLERVINGATGPTINVARAAVASAQTSLDQITKQQETLVTNARRKLYSDNLVAVADPGNAGAAVPTITGTYNGTQSGEYHIGFDTYNSYINNQVQYSGIEHGTTKKDNFPQPLGSLGLLVAFPPANYGAQDTWTVQIPNPNGNNYTANLNAYQSAVQSRDQSIAAAQAALAQAQASLASTAAAARPEDVVAAQAQLQSAYGSVQIAEASYGNTVITAPGDGTITMVAIAPGQMATANTPAIELIANNLTKQNALVVPKNAISARNGKYYVQLKTGTAVQEREVSLGIADEKNVEITAGLTEGDEVVVSQ